MKIVLDAMGGDYAPGNIVAGAIEAVKELPVSIVLVGKTDQIEVELAKFSYPKEKIEIVHASEVVGMKDSPTDVVRSKKDCSISVGVKLLKEEGYHAFVSAGNTGAVVAASTLFLRMIEGVDRPGIGLIIPTREAGFSFLIDVGANAETKPEHLYQYGHMARVYAKSVMGIENPSVRLLNIGEEEGKGSGIEKHAYKLMDGHIPGFLGNVEPNELFSGKADCIVATGFVGNVMIKVSEGMMESATTLLKREIKKSPLAILGTLLMRRKLRDIKRHADYSEYGGAPLLGVNGIVMISHGRSTPKAIKNAIRAAMHEVDYNILEELKVALIN